MFYACLICKIRFTCPGIPKIYLLTIQINHQPDATLFQFIILTFIYSSTCFGRFPAHHQELDDCSGSLWSYLRIVVIVVQFSWSGRITDYHHDVKVKRDAATAVIELLMMGEKMPETRWAVNKRQDNKLKNCCIWLVIYLNCTMMHGLTNLKLLSFFVTGRDEFRLQIREYEMVLPILDYCTVGGAAIDKGQKRRNCDCQGKTDDTRKGTCSSVSSSVMSLR